MNRSTPRVVAALLPLLLYSIVIYLISSMSDPPAPDFRIEWGDKINHAGAFGIMCLLAVRAALGLRPDAPRGTILLTGILFCALYGATDELHQAFVPGRQSDIIDWLADLTGALLAAGGLLLFWKLRPVRWLIGLPALALLVVAGSGPLRAQEIAPPLTGVLALDLTPLPEQTPAIEITPHKSSLLALGLSAAIPGTGQYYAEAPWWRVALYGVIEAAGWLGYSIYTEKGNTATEEFESFARNHWSVERYVGWIEANYQGWSAEEVDHEVAADALSRIRRSNDPTLPPWERIDFAELNRLERAVRGGFSHTLPAFGEQQYYEEIGKYVQYRSGWDDHDPAGDTVIYNPSRVSARNVDYTYQRLRANDLLSYADYALALVVLNHLGSAIDALIAAKNFNLRMGGKIEGSIYDGSGPRLTTSIGMQVRF